MDKIEGNDNYTISGNNNHIGDDKSTYNNSNIHNGNNYYASGDSSDSNEEKELKSFFENALQKTPGLNFIFGYSFFFIFLALNYLEHKFGLSFEYFIVILLSIALGCYVLYRFAQVKFSDIIYIKENEVVRGQASYSYNLIRVNDIRVDNGRIDFGFVDNEKRMYLDMHNDAAGLLRHKIEEYHHFYNEKR